MTAQSPKPHTPRSRLQRLIRTWVDPFLVALVAVMVIAIVLPTTPAARQAAATTSDFAIVLLFLVYGMRLPTTEVIDGLKNFKLQGAIFTATYLMFPLLGLLALVTTRSIIGPDMAQGLLFLSILPSTVQSSVAFTSIARGNVPGAICGATFSNTLGIFITPLLVWLLMGPAGAASSGGGFKTILLMLLAPFLVGQALERIVGPWLRRRAWLTQLTDRSSILIVVYAAVAAATAEGTWNALTPGSLIVLLLISGVVLTIALTVTWFGGKALRMPRDDQIALLMCGSKKSLATGLPMSAVLFPVATAATLALPLIIFHQLQLMVCAILARRLALTSPH